MARMLFKLLGQSMDSFSSAEEAAVARLSALHQRLVFDDGRVNIKSEAGFNACVAFLDVLASTSNALGLTHAPRSYRTSFSVNYRALFPDGAQHFRVDILEASIEQYAAIWVNGDKFEFSAQAMDLAGLLQASWAHLNGILDHSCEKRPRASARLARPELCKALQTLDAAWANFERIYISDLIGIEAKAREFVVQSVALEDHLQQLETQYGKGEALSSRCEYKEVQRRLVGCIARLNAVANYRRKGRDDLGVEVLFGAVAALQRCIAAEQDKQDAKMRSASQVLATDVVESFEAVREYLREVGSCLERVDPHLCNNPGLVQRLVDWEESWEVGARYVQHQGLLDAVSDLVSEIQGAQRSVPALTKMCDECDVELFMVLPRILWLCFLAKPRRHVELLQTLIPDRFADCKDGSKIPLTAVHSWHQDLQDFYYKFQKTMPLLVGAVSTDAARAAAWEILLQRAVIGSWANQESCPELALDVGLDTRAAVDDLLHELERWSMEVQRHCPEDWNQCSAILVQCLTDGHQARTDPTFCF